MAAHVVCGVGKHFSSLWLLTLYRPAVEDLWAMCVVNSFQFGTSMTSFPAFLLLAVVSLGFSIALHLKSRAMRRIPKNLTATIFSKTFNVFDPFSDCRRTFQSHFFFLLFSPMIAFVWVFLIVFVGLLWVVEAGLVGQLIILVLSLSLMMISEATECFSTANTLVRANERKTSFGQGDIVVLSMMRKTASKLRVYYLFLSVLFVALFFTMSLMFPDMILAFSQFIGFIVGVTIGIPLIGPFAAAFLLSLVTIAVFEVAKRLKAALFGFLPSDLFETDEIMARWIFHERF